MFASAPRRITNPISGRRQRIRDIQIGAETGYVLLLGGRIVGATLETSEEHWSATDDLPRDDQEPEFEGPWPEPYDVRGDR